MGTQYKQTPIGKVLEEWEVVMFWDERTFIRFEGGQT